MGRIIEILVLLNALGGVSTVVLGVATKRRRRRSNLEEVRRLERDNEEMDKIIDQYRRKSESGRSPFDSE